ncbi:MAG: tetratricopeptide repeat protein, partial [Saprospiraceae bacterium]|nr:tetratricopeptide repeat protein [Saprospiraceae bacterium]
SRDSLAHIYLKQKRWKEAEVQFLELTLYNPAYAPAWYRLACLASVNGRHDKAIEHLEKSLMNDKKNLRSLQNDHALDPIRTTDGYKALLKKYYPDEFKE